MKVFYSRVSTQEQNLERQLQNIAGFDYTFTDKCSGLIPLFERPNGSQLKKLINEGKLNHLEIHSIDRLGRNTMDVLGVWKELTEKGVTIVSRNPMLRNFDENGKADPFSELLLNLLSSLASYEKSMIRDRQLEGIKIRKDKGLYSGRRIGTVDTADSLLSKERSKKILQYLEKGYPYKEIAKIIPCSATTIVKVKKAKETLTKVA